MTHLKSQDAATIVSDMTGGKLDILVINGAAFVYERSNLTINDL